MIIDKLDEIIKYQKEHTERMQKLLSKREIIHKFLSWTPAPLGKDIEVTYPYYSDKIQITLMNWPLEMACCWCGELSILAGEFKFTAQAGYQYVQYLFNGFGVICYFDTSTCKWVGRYEEEEIEVVRKGFDDRKLVCSI